MIDEEETFEKYGYYSWNWSRKSAKRVIAICDECGKIRDVRRGEYRALCPSCAQMGEKGSNWQGGKVTCICKRCGKSFKRNPSAIKKGGGLFCSNSCAGKSRAGEKSPNWKGEEVIQICKTCGKAFKIKPSEIKRGKGIFCSHSCAGKSRAGEKCPRWNGGKVTRICKTCGKTFTADPAIIKNGAGNFCSKSCHMKSRVGKKSNGWKGGISFEPYCSKFNNEFKEYIRKKFGRICFLCDKTEEKNGRKLSVHHVSYDKACGCAETEEDKKAEDETCQFVPLCISCNSKVNGKRGYWEETIKNKMKNKLNGWYI